MAGTPSSVLVAVDFGEASARAIAAGGEIADRCGAATLRLLHADIVEAPAYFTPEQIGRLEHEQYLWQAQADQFLTGFGQRHTKVPFTTVIRRGPPVDAILEESVNAGLVIMGTHGRHGPKRWWLGSVAERVAREIRRPLLIVRAETPSAGADLFARTVVHAHLPVAGAATMAFARVLAGCVGGTVIDARGTWPDSPHLQSTATIVVVAVPDPKPSGWLSRQGELLLRSSAIPILFVPELETGAAT